MLMSCEAERGRRIAARSCMGGVICATRFPFARRAVENNGVIMHVCGTPKKYHLMLNSQIAETLPETVSMHHDRDRAGEIGAPIRFIRV